MSEASGRPSGSAMMRFSTSPSSLTSTASARPGPRLTNSTCFSVLLCFSTSTTPGAARQAGQHLAGLGEQFLRGAVPAAAGHAALDLGPLLLAHIADLEQPVDEQAQARLRRQAAGARMRRVDEAERLQIRHDVAHRGRRQRHRQRAAQIARADRLAGGEIGLDDALEDLARALVELAQARGSLAHGSQGVDIGMAHVGLKLRDAPARRQMP